MSKTQLRAGEAALTAPAGALERFATDVFARAGMPKADAVVVADVLVWANLRGVDTHGIMRVPRYVDLIENGDMNPRPAIAVRTETPASVLIEADRAAGPVAMLRRTAEPVVLDMATSVVSMGKLNQAKRTGEPIPEGWALDKDGNPTTDPQAAQIPLPMAGPKGSGLSLMIECITSLVAANPLLAESLEGTPEGRRHRQNGFVMAIDLAQFGDPEGFRREVDRLVKALKSLPVDPEAGEILMPGERGRRTFERRSHDGVPIPRAICDELQALANRLGVAMFLSSR